MIARRHKTTLFHTFLHFISRGAQCVSVLVWLLFLANFVADLTRAGPPKVFGNPIHRDDHVQFSPSDLKHLKESSAFFAFVTLVMFAISIAPRKFICVNTVVYYCVLVLSSVPGLGLLWTMLRDSSAHPTELTMFHYCCFVVINMIGFSLPLSLVAARLALREDSSQQTQPIHTTTTTTPEGS